jgi:hypothetical protein
MTLAELEQMVADLDRCSRKRSTPPVTSLRSASISARNRARRLRAPGSSGMQGHPLAADALAERLGELFQVQHVGADAQRPYEGHFEPGGILRRNLLDDHVDVAALSETSPGERADEPGARPGREVVAHDRPGTVSQAGRSLLALDTLERFAPGQRCRGGFGGHRHGDTIIVTPGLLGRALDVAPTPLRRAPLELFSATDGCAVVAR